MQTPRDTQDETLVFVFGALRSGTTVFRLMLDAHPGLRNPGEVDFLFDYLFPDPAHPGGWRYDISELAENRGFRASGLQIREGLDGLDLLRDFLVQYMAGTDHPLTLNIHRHLGRVLEVLPEVRIIHLLRDPRDVARSTIGMGWAGTLYHGVGQWITTETEWDEIRAGLSQTQFIELKFEDLITTPEAELRRVCDFVGISFDPRLLSYHENTTYSPPDPSLVAQWKHKSARKDVALVEGRVEKLMRARGYEPSGHPCIPGEFAQLRLRIANRFGIWKTAIQRYGFSLFFLEKLTRRFGPGPLHGHYRKRMRERDATVIK